MEHPDKGKLEKYAARQIPAAEMTTMILHLENCAECFDALQRITFSVENESVALFSEIETETFHLDYDEHLQPFVDNEADVATREIVEGHTQICANCAFQLRELREFSESLRLREIERKSAASVFGKLNALIQNLSHNLTFKIAFPLLFMIAGIVAIVWFWGNKEQQTFEKTEVADQKVSENRNGQTQTNSNENNQLTAKSVNQNRNPKTENANDSAKIETNKINENVLSEKDIFAEVDSLPNDLRSAVRKTLQNKKLAFPVFLAAIRENINLRGNSNKVSIQIYPKGEAVRESAPHFRWNHFAAPDEKYVVEIFDENNDSVEISPAIYAKDWKPKTVLRRGKTYVWEVRTEKSNAAGKFRILESAEIAEINRNSSKSSLIRGIVFASGGLLTEAENEFNQAIKNRENVELARELIIQLRNQK